MSRRNKVIWAIVGVEGVILALLVVFTAYALRKEVKGEETMAETEVMETAEVFAAEIQAKPTETEVNVNLSAEPSSEKEPATEVKTEEKPKIEPEEPKTEPESEETGVETYILVDISEQHFWVYRGEEVVLDSDVVTGCVSRRTTTPMGEFSVTEKKEDKALMNNSHSDYWLRFSGGCGFHDASWRSQFGEEIYLKNGSHGCINTPYENMVKLYELAEVGTRVIVQE